MPSDDTQTVQVAESRYASGELDARELLFFRQNYKFFAVFKPEGGMELLEVSLSGAKINAHIYLPAGFPAALFEAWIEYKADLLIEKEKPEPKPVTPGQEQLVKMSEAMTSWEAGFITARQMYEPLHEALLALMAIEDEKPPEATQAAEPESIFTEAQLDLLQAMPVSEEEAHALLAQEPDGEPIFDPNRHPSLSMVFETPKGHGIFMTNDFE